MLGMADPLSGAPVLVVSEPVLVCVVAVLVVFEPSVVGLLVDFEPSVVGLLVVFEPSVVGLFEVCSEVF